jgi:putative membrane protein insertion efficiency factor
MRAILTFLVLLPVRMYQAMISPIMPQVCRFYPSCSNYFVLAVQKHGPIRGACKGVWRVCRCNPFSKGGIDMP